MERSAIAWTQLAVLPDCAQAALGDPRLVDDDTWREHPLPYLRVQESGYGMVYGLAETDGLPIEVGELEGNLVAARLEFTNDVAELECSGQGRWIPLGRLRLGTDGAIAADKMQQHIAGYQHPITLPAGWYVAETFVTEADHFGIRIIAALED